MFFLLLLAQKVFSINFNGKIQDTEQSNKGQRNRSELALILSQMFHILSVPLAPLRFFIEANLRQNTVSQFA